jgi:hypothetical protein
VSLVQTSRQPVQEGCVIGVDDDGHRVALHDGGEVIVCDVLITAGRQRPDVRAGDIVLVAGADGGDRGYILGIVRLADDDEGSPPIPAALTLTAGESLTLECGDARLTMRRDGQIVVRGTEITSRARGVHKIKGAAVRIN